MHCKKIVFSLLFAETDGDNSLDSTKNKPRFVNSNMQFNNNKLILFFLVFLIGFLLCIHLLAISFS